MTMNTEIYNVAELRANRTPLSLRRHTAEALRDAERKGTWIQEASLRAYREWEQRGRDVIVLKDRLTKQSYLNPENAYLLAEVAEPSFTFKQIEKAKEPALQAILNADEHDWNDWAGLYGKQYMETIEAENTGLSFKDNFVADYAFLQQNAGLSKEEVDELHDFFSDQCWQSIYASVTGGVARGMFVFIADGGRGKSTYIETLAKLARDFTVEAFKRQGLVVKSPSCLSATDNMTGNTPPEWMLRGFFLNCQTVYFTEKANYLTNNTTLELFKGVLSGAELSFRLMHSEETQRGRQRATAFLDFNPSMANSLLSGKLGEDTATARRFFCLNIAEARAEAWDAEGNEGKGCLRLENPAEKERFWRQVKWAGTQSPYQLGVIPLELADNFSKLIKALAARSALSSAGLIRSYLAEETKLIVNKKKLSEDGIKPEALTRIGEGAVKDLILIPRDRDDRMRVFLRGCKGRKKFKCTDWFVLKPNWDWERIRKQMRALWEARPAGAPCDEYSLDTWLDGLEWQETEVGWELINSLQRSPIRTA
jgi:hypothetical protein